MNKVVDALYCLTRTDGGLVMILDSRGGIYALSIEHLQYAKISEDYTESLHEYNAIMDTMPGIHRLGCNDFDTNVMIRLSRSANCKRLVLLCV